MTGVAEPSDAKPEGLALRRAGLAMRTLNHVNALTSAVPSSEPVLPAADLAPSRPLGRLSDTTLTV